MGWGKYLLLGELGNRLDLEDADRRLKRMRSRVAAQGDRDSDQDARIDALEQENDEMKLLFIELVNTLIQKGLILDKDVAGMANRADTQTLSLEHDPEDQPLIDLAEALDRDRDWDQ